MENREDRTLMQIAYRKACAAVRADFVKEMAEGRLHLPDVVLALRAAYKRLARQYR